MNRPQDSTLGQTVAYPSTYDPNLLFPIPRAQGRSEIAGMNDELPFDGNDRWHAYEISWLDSKGKPVVATATITVPATSTNLIESKSLKLYLNSYNSARFATLTEAQQRIRDDLSQVAGADVDVQWGLPKITDIEDVGFAFKEADIVDLDVLDIDVTNYGPPDASFLSVNADVWVREVVFSRLLKSNCPVTSQPDWASVRIAYEGPQLDREGLLRYIISYREHCGFHEQCVEQIFCDVAVLGAKNLSVDARYTRRGGLDINPWRATKGHPIPVATRDERQ